MCQAKGEWRKGSSAGGCNNYGSVKDNPQFQLSVTRPTTVYVFVAQADHRSGGKRIWTGRRSCRHA